jgi:acetylornithine deacetylase/succinyl-diaminopimelate desuccinylase-like protein
MKEKVEIVEDILRRVGLDIRQVATAGNPVVPTEQQGWSGQVLDPYSHHEVQPADFLDEWESDPWAPEIRDGRFFAPGVADNKSNIAARVAPVCARQVVGGEFPVGVKFIIDGEEQIRSPRLMNFAHENSVLCAGIACIREIEGRGTSSVGSLESTPAWTGWVTPDLQRTRPTRASTLTTSSWE